MHWRSFFLFSRQRLGIFIISMVVGLIALFVTTGFLSTLVVIPLLPLVMLLPGKLFADGMFIFFVPLGVYGWSVTIACYAFFAFLWSFLRKPLYALLVYCVLTVIVIAIALLT